MLKIPASAWTPAVEPHGEVRDGVITSAFDRLHALPAPG
ncbi:hypothetical protein P3T39_004405 [Kitasatospora sp. GP82]|nr:hypothetical protein [Kitasatospora sp. GP82]